MRGFCEYRGLVTRLAYDEATATFKAEEVSHPFLQSAAIPAIDNTGAPAEPDPVGPEQSRRLVAEQGSRETTIELSLHDCNGAAAHRLGSVLRRVSTAHADHLGYPCNLVRQSATPPQFTDYLINNLGDPYLARTMGRRCATLSARRSAGSWISGNARRARVTGQSAPAGPRATSGHSTSPVSPFRTPCCCTAVKRTTPSPRRHASCA